MDSGRNAERALLRDKHQDRPLVHPDTSDDESTVSDASDDQSPTSRAYNIIGKLTPRTAKDLLRILPLFGGGAKRGRDEDEQSGERRAAKKMREEIVLQPGMSLPTLTLIKLNALLPGGKQPTLGFFERVEDAKANYRAIRATDSYGGGYGALTRHYKFKFGPSDPNISTIQRDTVDSAHATIRNSLSMTRYQAARATEIQVAYVFPPSLNGFASSFIFKFRRLAFDPLSSLASYFIASGNSRAGILPVHIFLCTTKQLPISSSICTLSRPTASLHSPYPMDSEAGGVTHRIAKDIGISACVRKQH
ncbi:hypothetical protein DFH07DRAFT_779209 [Mycena maculata]|uniref:Uncharacterized protein n=1 Tax=Mycena maculata TaxID=230809 RepID=A0AAD7MYL8_9AGAR|nr:hypothetical protein DFH07DRAFT_779209 [Mycena maculata]